MNEWEWRLLEEKATVDHLLICGMEVRIGDRVRLLPRRGGDILDIALRGQIATVESLEQDYEGKAHVCVVLDDDPGRDLGMMRQPGHRFFFDAAEVEPLPRSEQMQQKAAEEPRILVAGIGNVFLGDDGFGVEVAARIAKEGLQGPVRVADFGIRGLDLAYAMQSGYEIVILIDAYPSGQEPGTISVVELDLHDGSAESRAKSFVEPHAMNPIKVLSMAASMDGPLKRVLLVGCEPATFGDEEGKMGLSDPVETAVEEATWVVSNLVQRILEEGKTKPVN
jgi:hydrogenase maturation protease